MHFRGNVFGRTLVSRQQRRGSNRTQLLGFCVEFLLHSFSFIRQYEHSVLTCSRPENLDTTLLCSVSLQLPKYYTEMLGKKPALSKVNSLTPTRSSSSPPLESVRAQISQYIVKIAYVCGFFVHVSILVRVASPCTPHLQYTDDASMGVDFYVVNLVPVIICVVREESELSGSRIESRKFKHEHKSRSNTHPMQTQRVLHTFLPGLCDSARSAIAMCLVRAGMQR